MTNILVLNASSTHLKMKKLLISNVVEESSLFKNKEHPRPKCCPNPFKNAKMSHL